MSNVRQEHVVRLAADLWAVMVDHLVRSGVSRDKAGEFADKARWEIEGLLDFVE